jgi:hypothetical protein
MSTRVAERRLVSIDGSRLAIGARSQHRPGFSRTNPRKLSGLTRSAVLPFGPFGHQSHLAAALGLETYSKQTSIAFLTLLFSFFSSHSLTSLCVIPFATERPFLHFAHYRRFLSSFAYRASPVHVNAFPFDLNKVATRCALFENVRGNFRSPPRKATAPGVGSSN